MNVYFYLGMEIDMMETGLETRDRVMGKSDVGMELFMP